MKDKSGSPISEPSVQLQRRFDEYRSGQPHRTKLPETLWQAAVELVREHGLHPVTHPLRLDYMGLKRRLEGLASPEKKAAAPAFVELITAQPAMVAECVIEFESRIGSKMRIQWKGSATSDWASLLRAWRESER